MNRYEVRDSLRLAVGTVMPELLVAGMARAWATRLMPGDTRAADGATRAALRSFTGGASVGEACQEARRFVASWSRHPSHHRSTVEDLPIAS